MGEARQKAKACAAALKDRAVGGTARGRPGWGQRGGRPAQQEGLRWGPGSWEAGRRRDRCRSQ